MQGAGLGILLSALISVIFGMMVLSFPIGAYLVFNTELGGAINYEYPMGILPAGFSAETPAYLDLGMTFIILWSAYGVIFSIASLGPRTNIFKNLGSMMNGAYSNTNYMMTAISWFSVLVVVSYGINIIQESAGVSIQPPIIQNDLIQFVEVAKAPLIEEIGFRVLLIGVPLYAMYAHRTAVRDLPRVLWHPGRYLQIRTMATVIVLIAAVSLFFGMAHVISGESWGVGKIYQAVAGGMIIGWVYYRHGFVPALLVHWATNYFVFSYAYMIAEIGGISIREAFLHSMLQTFEIIFVIAGTLAILMMVLRRHGERRLDV